MFRFADYIKGLSVPTCTTLFALALVTAASGQIQSAPDNSKMNKAQSRDMTADQQPNGKSDVELTAQIRRSVVADKTLSTYGHNVKIIVVNGAVSLKGPVHSDDEKQNIAAKAADVVGKDKVTNQLTVKQ